MFENIRKLYSETFKKEALICVEKASAHSISSYKLAHIEKWLNKFSDSTSYSELKKLIKEFGLEVFRVLNNHISCG